MKALILSLVVSVFVFPLAVQASLDYVPGEILVKMKENSNRATILGKVAAKAQVLHEKSWPGLGLHKFSMKTSDSMVDALNRLREDRNVLYAEPNYYFEEAGSRSYEATDADIGVIESWAVASEASLGDAPIIAVIDSGLDINHRVFKETGRLWKNQQEVPDNGFDDDGNGYVDDLHGWNFKDYSADVDDLSGHGTHVAGIALGVSEDIFPYYFDSSEPAKVQIMPLKFLGADGKGKTSDAVEAVYYAVNNGARVISNSWGGYNYSAALHEALAYAYKMQVIIVSASGNFESNNDNLPLYPANYDIPSMISVAATTDFDSLAPFSNYGKKSVHIAAPGVGIISTLPGKDGGYGGKSGTSMAAPFISGLAAMLMREAPSYSGFQIREKILRSGRYFSHLSNYVQTSKVMNAEEAMVTTQEANKVSANGFQPSYTPVYQQSSGRNIASGFAGGFGCGQVSQMYGDMNSKLSQGEPTGPPSLAVLVLILLPLIIAFGLKYYLRQDERRSEARRRVLISGRIITEHGMVQSVQVQCWSVSGAGLQLKDDIASKLEGKRLRLQLDSKFGKVTIPKALVVRQSENGYLGLKFENE